MPHLFTKAISSTKAIVEAIYQEDQIGDDLKASGTLILDIPAAEVHEGKQPVLYLNPQNNTVWYEYEEAQTSSETVEDLKLRLNEAEGKLSDAEGRLSSTEDTLFQIMFGGI